MHITPLPHSDCSPLADSQLHPCRCEGASRSWASPRWGRWGSGSSKTLSALSATDWGGGGRRGVERTRAQRSPADMEGVALVGGLRGREMIIFPESPAAGCGHEATGGWLVTGKLRQDAGLSELGCRPRSTCT